MSRIEIEKSPEKDFLTSFQAKAEQTLVGCRKAIIFAEIFLAIKAKERNFIYF